MKERKVFCDDIYFLGEALKEAAKSEKKGEVPVGAVVTFRGEIIGRGHNNGIKKNDPTSHAEINAIRNASRNIKNYRLNECRLFVTLEPCPMCAGAMVWARISEVVFGAYDAKAGACGSVFNIAHNKELNHRIKIVGGLMEKECSSLMQKFFKERRLKKLVSN